MPQTTTRTLPLPCAAAMAFICGVGLLSAGPASAAMLQAAAQPQLAMVASVDTGSATPANATEADTSRTAAPAAGSALQVGFGSVQFGGLLQAWYVDGEEAARGFRMRRAVLTFKGELSSDVRWTLSVDPAKALQLNSAYTDLGDTRAVSGTSANQASLLLQDAFISLSSGWLRVDAGQFLIPLGYEGSALSSAQLETVDCTQFTCVGKLGQLRDLGVAARLDLPVAATVTLGVFNGLGESQNSPDQNPEKALVGRLSLATPVRGLQLGASGAWGGEQDDAVARRRTGVEAVYAAGPLRLRGELMQAEDGALRRIGYYGLAAYRHGRVQGVLRYDAWDAGTAAERIEYIVGINYFLPVAPVKLMVNYAQRRTGTAAERHVLRTALQASW